jgi:hypothetical protein
MPTEFERELSYCLHQLAPNPPDLDRVHQMIAIASRSEAKSILRSSPTFPARIRTGRNGLAALAVPLLVAAAGIALVIFPHNLIVRDDDPGRPRATAVADAAARKTEPCVADALRVALGSSEVAGVKGPALDLVMTNVSMAACTLTMTPVVSLRGRGAQITVPMRWGLAPPPVAVSAGHRAIFKLTFIDLRVGCPTSSVGWSVVLAGDQYPATSMPLALTGCKMVPEALTFAEVE